MEHGAHNTAILNKMQVEIAAKDVAHGGHSMAKMLQLLPRLIEHVTYARVIVDDGIAQMFHDTDLEDVADALQVGIEGFKRRNQKGAQKGMHPCDKGNCPSTGRIEAQQGALHALNKMLHALQTVSLPLEFALCTLGSPAQGSALTKKQEKLLQLHNVVSGGIQDGQCVMGEIRQVVIVRRSPSRQYEMLIPGPTTGHQVAVDFALVVPTANAQLRMKILQMGLYFGIE